MEIKIIFDKAAIDKKLYIGWGFSVLVDNRILFDTGEKGEWLMNNIKRLNVNIDGIEGIVISHDHWDHTGGLSALLKNKAAGTPVYICPNFSMELKDQITGYGGVPVETAEFKEIAGNIYITGEIHGRYKGSLMPEQALVLKTVNGISVITGCAHPGILEMLDLVKKEFPADCFSLVMGGFHLLDEDNRMLDFIVREFKNMGIEIVVPTHCSGPTAEKFFAKKYGGNFIAAKAGQIICI